MDNKKREEVNSSDKWNIELVYKDIDSFNADMEKTLKEIDILENMQTDFLTSSEKFKEFLMQDEKTSRMIEKLSVYANCRNDEDKREAKYQELSGKITNLYSLYNEKTSSVIPEILKLDKKIIDKYIEEQKELEPYKYYFDVIFLKKEHILDEQVEKVLSSYLPVLSAPSEISSYLTNADIKFGFIEDENKNKVELTESNYSIFLKSKNRDVRKQAFKTMLNTYGNFKNTLTSSYSGAINYDTITARLRNYTSSIEMYLSSKKIPIELYNNLIKTVRSNIDVLYDYYALKKDILGLTEFHLYDGYVKVIKDNEKKYSYDEAKEIVLKALNILGDDYIRVLETAFTEGWVDKYPNIGKRTGAYSTGSYDTLPYVLLNYTNTYNDISTLAHELGHSMHTYYSNKYNPYINSGYPIFLAEIASTTNELLLSNYMYLNSSTKEEKLDILNEKLDLFKATIFRQTMFAEFEKNAHEYVEDKNILTSDYLCDMYYKLNKDYFGDNVIVDDEIKYEWLRIPHFYTPFYVYQYATSLSISCYIAENIINKTPGFKEKYIEFLKSGGRNYPLEVLKIIDIDLTNTEIFESAIKLFKNTIEEFKKVYYKE